MKLSIFFLILTGFICYWISVLTDPLKYLLIWPAVNLLILALAYASNQPNLIMNKKDDGSISPILLALNLPWLLITWGVFRLQISFEKDFANQLEGSNLWISRRPTSRDDLSQFDLVIDLTAEFSKDQIKVKYRCFPNLDGHILKHNKPISSEWTDKKVLIHCANGYGRSSLYAAILLVEWQFCSDFKAALDLIKNNRKKAVPNSHQRKWLLNC